tara:strand:+ start:224 stop:514 length:291 start_codon:yes stop_codon:yes gene_type:complete
MRKDKPKVLDEVWTEDRVRSFLEIRSFDQTDHSFHMLLKAYQSMRASDFEKFVGFFTNDGRDVNCTNGNDQTVLSIITQHNKSAEYAAILRAAGAS